MLKQFSTFVAVGVLATATHYLCALGLIEGVDANVYLGNLGGYLAAVGVSFLGHSWLTFRQPLSRAALQRFVPASLSTLATSQLVLWALQAGTSLPPRLTMALAVLVSVVQSYLINRWWVYRQRTAANNAPPDR